MALCDILTPEWLKTNFLFGIVLTDDEGNPYPDSLFEHSIEMAISVLEDSLDVHLGDNILQSERHDVSDWESETYYLTHVDLRPIRRIVSGAVRFGAFSPTGLPAGWFHISSDTAGQVQIMPGPEGLSGFSFNGGVPLLGIDTLTPRPYTPLWLTINYEAGFELTPDGTATVDRTGTGFRTVIGTDTIWTLANLRKKYIRVGEDVRKVVRVISDTELEVSEDFLADYTDELLVVLDYPAMLIEAVAILAAMLPLDTAGDLIVGAGIATQSIGIDALSQSIGTTSSATNSGYGARVIQGRKRLKDDIMPALKHKFATPHFFAI